MAKAADATVQVGQVTDQNPIINDPHHEPTRHWHFGDGAPEIRDGRRPAGYLPPAPKGQQQLTFSSEVVRLEQVNRIRDRVREWREGAYPGATQVTKALFEHWFDEGGQFTITQVVTTVDGCTDSTTRVVIVSDHVV